MKKTKVVFIIFLVIVISMIFSGISCAHSVELDSTGLIVMPWGITGGKGNISIDNEKEKNYTLYYQCIIFQDDVNTKYKKLSDEGVAERKRLNEIYQKLTNERKNLASERDTAKENYDNAVKANKPEAELEKLKTAYETAKKNYEDKDKEVYESTKEYNAYTDELNSKLTELTPTYVESNWKKTNDGSFEVDLTQFSGERSFVLWAKLVTASGNTYYNEAVYSTIGTKPTEVDVTGVSLDKKDITITEGSEYTLTATIAPADATNKVVDWSSDNEKVATVSNGKITAKSAGSATITVTTKDGEYKATAKVTVTAKKTDSATGTDVKSDEEKKTDMNSATEEKKTDDKKPETNSTIDENKIVTISTNSSNDETIAQTKTLPRTGVFSILGILATIIGVVAIIFFRKYKYINI